MNLKKRESSEPKLKKKDVWFFFQSFKMSNSKIPNMARYFCNVVLAYLMFLQNFYDVQMPAYSVIWRHVKCIYKGIIDLRFEFVWPEIFHLSGKYFEKQLAGMCQMPYISPLIAMIESTKKWTCTTTAHPKGDCQKNFILMILYAHLVKSILDFVVRFICWHHHCSKRWFTKPKNVSFWSKFVKTSQVGHNSWKSCKAIKKEVDAKIIWI